MSHKQGKKNRKHGRNKAFCQQYRLEGRREKNKARKLAKHLKYQPTDQLAKAAFEALPQLARKRVSIEAGPQA